MAPDPALQQAKRQWFAAKFRLDGSNVAERPYAAARFESDAEQIGGSWPGGNRPIPRPRTTDEG